MAKRVLLVEDEANIVEAISFLLSRNGFTVHVHSDGATANERIREFPPDLLILDVMLPGRSGFEILDTLRSTPETADLPVLMLTARSQKRDRAQAEDLGVTRFMSKPFSNTELVEAVRALTGAQG